MYFFLSLAVWMLSPRVVAVVRSHCSTPSSLAFKTEWVRIRSTGWPVGQSRAANSPFSRAQHRPGGQRQTRGRKSGQSIECCLLRRTDNILSPPNLPQSHSLPSKFSTTSASVWVSMYLRDLKLLLTLLICLEMTRWRPLECNCHYCHYRCCKSIKSVFTTTATRHATPHRAMPTQVCNRLGSTRLSSTQRCGARLRSTRRRVIHRFIDRSIERKNEWRNERADLSS